MKSRGVTMNIGGFLALLMAGWLGSAQPVHADKSINGFIEQISIPARSLTVDTGKEVVTLNVGNHTWITKDKLDCDLSNLRVGDRVRASAFTSNGLLSAMRVDALTIGRRRIIKGTVVEVLPDTLLFKVDQRGQSHERITTIAYDSATLIVHGGSQVGINGLKVGDNVTIVSGSQIQSTPLATRVDISTQVDKQAVLAYGFLKAVEDQTLVIQSWRDGEEEFIATDTVRVMTRNKKPVILGDLMRGDRILAVGIRNFAGGVDAQMIAAQSPDVRFTGTIEAIDPSKKAVRLKPFGENSQPVDMMLLTSSITWLNGRDATLDHLKVGDMATVTCLIHPEGPWGVAVLEVVRLSNLSLSPPVKPGSSR